MVELEHPTSNGLMEVVIFDLHRNFHITHIYTKQEDLILRASYLRKALGIRTGLQPEEALLFRDKCVMKSELVKNPSIKAPPFERVFSPVNILTFIQKHGYPVILKPTLGSASAGIKLIHSLDQLHAYLGKEFYDRIDEKGKVMDYSGDMLIEGFVDGGMYHVNGFAKDGRIVSVFPFQYISTNLNFTQGKAYGNLSINRSDALYTPLVDFAQQVLSSLPCPPFLVFHLELFITKGEILLCEIAARRPGGSIALLMDDLLGGKGVFPKLEFRWSNGLEVESSSVAVAESDLHHRVGDAMIPLEIGQLASIPTTVDLASLTDESTTTTIIPISKVGTLYTGFDINRINTCCRIKYKTTSFVALETALTHLEQRISLTKSLIKYSPLSGVSQ